MIFADKHPVKEFTIIHSDHGLTLCEKQSGSFLTLRYKEDIENLKALVEGITISSEFEPKHHESINLSAHVKVTYNVNG